MLNIRNMKHLAQAIGVTVEEIRDVLKAPEVFYEELMFFSQNPINLNRTLREELERLPFLVGLSQLV